MEFTYGELARAGIMFLAGAIAYALTLKLRIKKIGIVRPGRRVGNSTRLADWYIQQLFDETMIVVRDHYWGENGEASYNGHIHLFRLIQRRLSIEHPAVGVQYDERRFTIKLMK
jgi:hypothetical protein